MLLPSIPPKYHVGRPFQRGASLIVFTLVLTFVILPIVGLCIDVAIQYWIKAKLSSAVDSAALAAARSLSVGATIASQTANAQSVGRQYFAANFPANTLGTTVFGGAQVANSVSITVTSASNLITVSAAAQVNAPLYFMKVLHISSGTIAATSQTTRRNANVLLVLDRSGSMNTNNSCSALVAAVQTFTNQFINGRDQLGMVTFSTSANLDYPPNLYFASSSPTINSVINTMACVGATSTPQALTLAYQEMQSINEPGALNVILLFTDGQANAVVATYPIKTQGDTRYNATNTSTSAYVGPSGCSASDVLLGGFTDFSGSANLTGYTGGVYSVSPPPPINGGSSSPSGIYAPGCSFNSSVIYGRNDVAYIPSPDYYGNPTVGYKPAPTFTTGPYSGQIRSDSPQAIRYAAMNAADAVSQQIRSNSTLGIVTYTIGLAGNENIPMDTDFLERIANDPRASNYNSSQPQGLFALATDNASLSDAFNAIASQILRLSK